jgi:2-polyprenyl-6-methoxyphenol hydroxylase-like FAD-dependent oxidoreductase
VTTRAPSPPDAVDVVIVGGGPVGSALAVELGLRGVEALVLERRPAISRTNVRARGISIRSMEHFRRLGVATALRESVTVPAEWKASGLHVIHESIAGHELFRPEAGDERDWREVAAEPGHYLPQYATNHVLRQRASELSVSTYTGQQVVSIAQEPDQVVTIAAATDGTRTEVRSRYVVGADGGQSVVRESAGIRREESAPFARAINVNVRIPHLFEQLGTPPAAGGLIINQDVFGFFVAFDRDRWGFMCGPYPLDTDLAAVDIEAEAHKRIGAVVPIEIESASSFDFGTAIATNYGSGRILLAGDAAHLFPPHLGQNLNIGIGDAANLGWKLAASVQGWGGPRLLDSYSVERRPIAVHTAHASASVARGWARQLEADQTGAPIAHLGAGPARARELIRREGVAKGVDSTSETRRRDLGRRLFELVRQVTYGIVLDERYDGSGIVVDDGTNAPPWNSADYEPLARPGHRAPHALVANGVPLYDVLGAGFTLLDFGAAPTAVAALEKAAADRGIPLAVLAIDDRSVRALYERRLALIRPDQHVAWRADDAPPDAGSLIDIIRGAAH